jgi:Glu-tRNA(Gln) amidotransferase subunit E-like FAD-binding protein
MSEVLRALRDVTLAREGVISTLAAIARGIPFTHDTVPPPCTPRELEAVIHEASVALQQNLRRPDRRKEALMGMIMNRVRGRVPGRAVAELIEREWKEVRP